MSEMKIISADSHAMEPDDIFERLPADLRARAPRVEKRNGASYLIQEGQRPIRLDVAASRLTEEDKRREFRDERGERSGRASGADIPLRIADLEEDGVSAEVIYPQAIFSALTAPDPGYQTGFCAMYNDWYHETFTGNMDRFVPSACIPMADIEGP